MIQIISHYCGNSVSGNTNDLNKKIKDWEDSFPNGIITTYAQTSITDSYWVTTIVYEECLIPQFKNK